MQSASVVTIVERLDAAGVRYLIVGGLAVVAHGHVRFTADVDIVLEMSAENLERALRTFDGLGYRPRAPVTLLAFADAGQRDEWTRDKGLTVFSLWSSAHTATEVDLFVASPFDDFDEAYRRAARREIAAGVWAPFVSLDDLIALKRKAGRPQDLLDVEKLVAIRDGEGVEIDRLRETEGEWEVGWDGHALAQERRLAVLGLEQKMLWLEEAQRLVERLKATAPAPS